MKHLRSMFSALLLLGLAAPGSLAGQEEQQQPGHHEEHEQAQHQEKVHACCSMMSQAEHGMQGMQMQHMRQQMAMMHVAVYAPPHLLERREALGLSDEQASRLEELGKELVELHDQAAAEAKGHHEQAMQLWQAQAPDVGRLREHAQAAMRAEENAKLALLTVAAQAKSVLTPEQQGRVAGWLDMQQQMMHQHMQQMMHGEGERAERHERQP